jgi:hypothetical protein
MMTKTAKSQDTQETKEPKQKQKETAYIVQEDCRCMYNHQTLELCKGQEVDHQLGAYLEETGGPVERK